MVMNLSHKVAVLFGVALAICPAHLMMGANEPSIQNVNLSNIPDPIKEISQQYKQETIGLKQSAADDVLMAAMGLLGVNYKWGGISPQGGMDCSGFIYYIFKTSRNINLPRTAAKMAKLGIPVDKDKLQPGDLVFFATHGNGKVSHVGVYIGDGKFIHSPRTGKSVEIRPFNNSYWSSHYLWARRIP
jgi:hypothetical protein